LQLKSWPSASSRGAQFTKRGGSGFNSSLTLNDLGLADDGLGLCLKWTDRRMCRARSPERLRASKYLILIKPVSCHFEKTRLLASPFYSTAIPFRIRFRIRFRIPIRVRSIFGFLLGFLFRLSLRFLLGFVLGFPLAVMLACVSLPSLARIGSPLWFCGRIAGEAPQTDD